MTPHEGQDKNWSLLYSVFPNGRKGKLLKLTVFILSIFTCFNSLAGDVLSKFPEQIDPKSSYVFYSHGYIVEGKNPTPAHPRWGVYDYPAILVELSSINAHIIAEHRAAKSNPFEHAEKLAKQAKRLIKEGVPASNITFVGFSRGGFITAITSSYLANRDINYAIFAACTSSLASHKDIKIHGALLSIYETSDSVGSCDEVVRRDSKTIKSYKEISISTGKEHGAFYRPIDAWVQPLKEWLQREKL